MLDIGWLIDAPSAKFVWFTPKVIDDSNYVEIKCPFDINLSIKQDQNGKYKLIINTPPQFLSSNLSILNNHIMLTEPSRWRNPKNPILQVITPYRFICDNECLINQLPPIFSDNAINWPGTCVTGKFPLHIWPRILMFAFEWHNTAIPLEIKRGEPWFYLRFDSYRTIEEQINLIPAKLTDELKEYCAGLDGVVNYVSQTFSLFDVAMERRPKKLLR